MGQLRAVSVFGVANNRGGVLFHDGNRAGVPRGGAHEFIEDEDPNSRQKRQHQDVLGGRLTPTAGLRTED